MIYVGRVKDEFAGDDLIIEFDLQNANYFSNIKILSWECEDDDPVLTNIENKLKYYHEDNEYKATFYSVEEEGPAGDQSEISDETIETYHTTQSTSYGAGNYWQLEQIQKRDLTTTNYHNYVYDEDGTNVDVYVVDTGILHSHLHLGDATRSFNIPAGDYDPDSYGLGGSSGDNVDDNSHGTYCSLCVGGRHDNSQGGGYGPGVAKGVQFYALKVLNSAGNGSGVTIAAGINGVISHHNAKTATATMYVRVAGGKYYINDVLTKSFNLFPGMTYKFHQEDGTNANHPLRFSTTVDGTFGGGAIYDTDVTEVGIPGQAGAYTQIIVSSSTPATLYYYCGNHALYGGDGVVTVKTAHPTVNKKPSIINISIGHGIPTTSARYINVDTAGTSSGDIIEDALKTATMAGIHVVNSAGNGYDNNDGDTVGPLKTEYNIGTIGLAYPSETTNTDAGQGLPIIVGATTDNAGTGSGNTTYGTGYNNNISPTTGRNHAAHTATAMAYFSNYGRANTVNAPGRYVKVPGWNNFTVGNSWPMYSISGTSFSCPITAGLVAQYVGLHPEVNPLEVKDWIKTVASTDVNGTGITDIETEITLQANPITTAGGAGTHPGTGTNTAQLMLLPNHGIQVSDYLQLRGVVGSGGGNLGGVPEDSFNGWHKVVNIAGDVVDIALLDIGGNPVVPASADTSGGLNVKFLALMQSGADTHDYTEGVIWEGDNIELKTSSGGSTNVYWPEVGGIYYQQGVCPPGEFIYPTPNRHLFMPYQEYTATWTTGNSTAGIHGLTAVTEGNPVNVDLSASMLNGNGDEPFTNNTYSVSAGSLPAGVTLNTSTGAITGTAPTLTENTSYEWTAQVTNGYGIQTKKYQMTILESSSPTPVVSLAGGISFTDGLSVSIPSVNINLESLITGLESPTIVTTAGGSDSRLFITEQAGKIKVYKNGNVLGTAFLDITSSVQTLTANYDERGLLGMAFHPNYTSNGKYYVYYSKAKTGAGIDHESIVAQYVVTDPANDDVSGTTETIILQFDQPQSNHNGGSMFFGTDGYLYISTGDGGGQNDPNNLALDRTSILGKILRIDVDTGSPYSIPATNPYKNHGTYLEEIYAHGFRNPWKMSQETGTGNIWVGDVGQDTQEEINQVVSGGNYGWSVIEGTYTHNSSRTSAWATQDGVTDQQWLDALKTPVATYTHTGGTVNGLAVIGGHVYRGATCTELIGKYVFGDWSTSFAGTTGKIYYLTDQNTIAELNPNTISLSESVTGFGEDNLKELYVITKTGINHNANTTGTIYKLAGNKLE